MCLHTQWEVYGGDSFGSMKKKSHEQTFHITGHLYKEGTNYTALPLSGKAV